jgi:methionyl-tRNA formyltransferase
VNAQGLRLVFMGTPDFAVTALRGLAASHHEVIAVYTQPPRPAGRGGHARPTPVELAARTLDLEMRSPRTLRGEEDQAGFAALGADAAVVAAYGLLLPKPVLAAPRLGCLNIHPSLLPRWRGAAPIPRALMAGDAKTGVCIMQLDAGLDTGPVLAREQTAIGPRENAGDLEDRLANTGRDLMLSVLDDLAAGSLRPVPQPDAGATYAPKIEKSETQIDWRRPADEIDCHVRGLAPRLGAWFALGSERIRVLAAEAITHAHAPPGHTIDDTLGVACGKGALRLTRLQRPGRKAMSAAEFLRGRPVPAGTDLS